MTRSADKVVARLREGKCIKGYTHDFDPVKETFHVSEAKNTSKVVEVATSQLKALFFVKTFDGNRDHADARESAAKNFDKMSGFKVKVTFTDGEEIYGSTSSYSLGQRGFYMIPADMEDNNKKIFVVRESIERMEIWRTSTQLFEAPSRD
jgi:hypothetical protein